MCWLHPVRITISPFCNVISCTVLRPAACTRKMMFDKV